MEQETNEQLPQALPEKKKRTLTEKQIKNLELMRQKKMVKKKAVELIAKSQREPEKSQREPEKSQREPEKDDEISNLKKELYELKEQMSKKRKISSPKNITKRKKIENEDEEDDGEYGSYHYVNPYLNQLIRGR